MVNHIIIIMNIITNQNLYKNSKMNISRLERVMHYLPSIQKLILAYVGDHTQWNLIATTSTLNVTDTLAPLQTMNFQIVDPEVDVLGDDWVNIYDTMVREVCTEWEEMVIISTKEAFTEQYHLQDFSSAYYYCLQYLDQDITMRVCRFQYLLRCSPLYRRAHCFAQNTWLHRSIITSTQMVLQ